MDQVTLYVGSGLSAVICFLVYLLTVHFIEYKDNMKNLSCMVSSKRKKYVMLGSAAAAVLVSVVRVLTLRRPIILYDDSVIVVQMLIHAGIGTVVGIIGGNVALVVARKEAEDVIAEKKKAEQKKEEAYQSSVLRGEWVFPHMEFFELCNANKIPVHDSSDFAKLKLQKAVQMILDRHRIPPEIGKLHLNRGEEYYRLAEEEIRAEARRQAEADSTLTRYTPAEAEKRLLEGIHQVRKLHGLQKREHMLRNQIAGLEAERNAIYESLNGSDNQPRFTYTKEKNWATWGGIADGLAGPAAGVATALKVQQDNERIREQNKVFMQANAMLDAMARQHREKMLAKCAELREQQKKLEDELETLQLKVVFDQPESEEIADCLSLKGATFEKTESGILSVSAKVSCVIPPERKPIPQLVVDGSIHARVYTGDRFVEDIYFILPGNGISAAGSSCQVHSLCTTALPVEGEYRLELGEDSSLWLMER